jgi:hypothetical protein
MTAGNPSEWDDLFTTQLIPAVLEYLLEVWDRIEKPSEDELEDRTSDRLFLALKTGKNRDIHPFLIRREDLELSTDLDEESGWKDIVFFPPANDEDVYFCLEAKRLNARVKGVMRSLADKYVKDGMQRFVDRKYSRYVRHGAMLGYVLDGDVDRAMSNVLNNIRENYASLRMKPPGEWANSPVRPADPHAKLTQHQRLNETAAFGIHHLFVAGLAPLPATRKPTTPRSAERTKGSRRKKKPE